MIFWKSPRTDANVTVPDSLSNLSLPTTKIRYLWLAITPKPVKIKFIQAHHSLDIWLNFKLSKKQISKFRSVTSWWRHKA